MRYAYLVVVDTDEAWVNRHPQYTDAFIRNEIDNKLSDALRYELAFEKVAVRELSRPVPTVDPSAITLEALRQNVEDRCDHCGTSWNEPNPWCAGHPNPR